LGQHLGKSVLPFVQRLVELIVRVAAQTWWLGFPAEVRSVATTTALGCFMAINMVALLMWISIRRTTIKQD
jgi:hypothetical protein